MDNNVHSQWAVAFTTWTLLQLLCEPLTVYLPSPYEEEDQDDRLRDIVDEVGQATYDPLQLIETALHNFRLCTAINGYDDDVRNWVKPRSTTWFSRFLLAEYDDTRWIQMFRMTKKSVFALADLLKPQVVKKDTRYRLAIHVLIRVACCLFKLTHGASLFICNEMFAVGKSTISCMLRDVVHAINETLRHELSWPTRERMRRTQQNFQDLCGLPAIMGAIDGTHINISKPQHGPTDYFYFKSGGYTLNCQIVVDSEKRFLDLYLGMPHSINDSRVLRRSSLYDLAMHNNLLHDDYSVQGFSPYLIGHLGYPLLPWLMVPHHYGGHLSLAETLFNKKLRRGRCVVENAFGILKQKFRELLTKSDLHVAFLPNVIIACVILHNILLGQSDEEVHNLLQVLRTEELDGEVVDDQAALEDALEGLVKQMAAAAATDKRIGLGVFLSQQRLRPL